jgi:cystathionine beta-lyase family protein involved in aluminum resistance
MAPQTTGEALKGGRLVAEVLSRQGFPVVPAAGPTRVPSMITAVKLGSRERMVAFCKGIQDRCPVGSYITPEPGEASAVVCVQGRAVHSWCNLLQAVGAALLAGCRAFLALYMAQGCSWVECRHD